MAVSGTTHSVTATSTATGTITNDDSATLTIVGGSATEGKSIPFTVTLDKAVAGGLTVTPTFTDGTATKGTDYTAPTTALDFEGTAGESVIFTVPTTDDSDVEANETFTVGLSVSGTTHDVTATSTATGTITNDDSATVTIADASADEGDAISFTVTLDKAVPDGLTVTPDFTDGTATEGTDYTENTAALTFTGTAGETQTFTISTSEDEDIEDDETFTVGLAVSGTTHSVTATSTATGTITNDDSAKVTATINNDDSAKGQIAEDDDSGLTITFDDANTKTDEVSSQSTRIGGIEEVIEGSSKKVTVSYSRPPARFGAIPPIHVKVSILRPSYGKNRVNSADFSVSPGKVKLENNSSAQWTITAIADNVVEPDREVSLMRIEKWNSAGTRINYVLTQSGPHFVDASTATVTVSSASASEGDKITFTATLDNAVVGGLTATPTYTNGSGNDKASASDYTTNTNALTFTGTAGETKTFTVQTTEDEIDEADETFTVGLTISNASSRVTASAGTGTINNDDRPTLTVNDASVNEGGTMTFTATLDKATGDDFAVTPTYTNGTAAATDYTANTNAVTFAGTAGETKTFTVQTTQDDVMESNETFTVGLTVSEDLSRPRSMELLLDTTDTGTGTINNDDNAAVTISDASVDEGGTMTFTIALDKAVSSGFTVTPTYTNGTGNDKASATDYTANTASLSFSGTANETKTFTVQTTQDATAEQTETFTVGLTLSGTSLGVDVTDTGIGTINDDDAAKVTVSNASASEGESMTFTLTLDEAASGGFTVNPTFTDGTATGKSGTGKDFQRRIKVNGNYVTDITFTGTAGETKTFTVGTKEDDVVEHDETFTVGLRHTLDSANKTVNLSAVGTGTITNDDEALVTFNNLIRPGIYEGDKGTFTATLDKAVQGGFKATPNFSKGALDKDAAKLGVDYTGDATVLTFAGTAGETKTVTVTTIEDDDVEAKGEPFTVWLAFTDAPSGVRNAKAGGSGIIWDDDRAKVTVNDASATEGSTMTFTVTLTKTVSSTFTVTPNFTNGTAASTDYTANTTALSFTGTANETKTFTVATTQDDVTESDETFTVGLTVPGDSGVIATDKGTGTITNDDTATLTVNDASADEGESMTFTATLDKKVQGGLTVTPTYTDGTASATDYTANTTALTFTGTGQRNQDFYRCDH